MAICRDCKKRFLMDENGRCPHCGWVVSYTCPNCGYDIYPNKDLIQCPICFYFKCPICDNCKCNKFDNFGEEDERLSKWKEHIKSKCIYLNQDFCKKTEKKCNMFDCIFTKVSLRERKLQ